MRFGYRSRQMLAGAVAVGLSSSALGQYYPAAIPQVTVVPQTGSYYATNQTVSVEDNYIPNVIWRENGAASYQALKVQAIAARGYMYYKLTNTPNAGKATSVKDSTADQVYSKAGSAPFTRATATTTQQKYLLAADETERELLITSTGETVCTFFVAAGKPDTAIDTTTYWPGGTAPLGQWETGDSDPTGTEHWVTYQRGKTGAAVTGTPLGSLTNPVNRGAMSQNGANFLGAGRSTGAGGTFAAWDYLDIVKYYYGADTQLALAKVPATGEAPAFTKQICSFDYTEGYLRNAMNLRANQQINYGGSSHVRDTTTAQSGAASQKLTIDFVPNIFSTDPGSFVYDHVAGMMMGTEANPTINDNLIGTKAANLLIEAGRGSIGFWVKTTTQNLSAAPTLDDSADGTERAVTRNIIGDGAWHKYEWFIADNAEWASGLGTNAINGNWTLDSLRFSGKSDAVFNLDSVFYSASASTPTNQWVYDADGMWNSAGNWTSSMPNAMGATANFLGATTAKRTITFNGPVTVGTMNFNQPLGYELFSNAITYGALTFDVLSGSASINVQSTGTQTMNLSPSVRDNLAIDVVSGGTLAMTGGISMGSFSSGRNLVKTGAGTLVLGGTLNFNAISWLDTRAGQTIVNTDLGNGTADKATLNADGATARVTLNATQRLRDVTILNDSRVSLAANGSRFIRSRTLSITSGGALDLNDNDLVVDYSSYGASPFSSIRGYVLSGYSAVLDSSKTGIVSTSGQNTGGATILALFDNALANMSEWPTGSGNLVPANSVLGKYTYIGDTNMDGQVTPQDYTAIDANLGTTVDPGIAWFYGDTNFDGSIDATDYTGIDAALGLGQGNPLAVAAVPEPAAGVGLALGTLLLRRRRARAN